MRSADNSMNFAGKRAEVVLPKDALSKEREKTQKYLDIAGAPVVAIDTAGKVTLISKKGCEILGYKPRQIIGKDWFENFIPERLRGEVKAVFSKLIAGDPVEDFEGAVLDRKGEETFILWHSSVMTDEEGNIIGGLFSGEDITERKRIEEALRESEARFRATFKDAAIGIARVDLQGRPLESNPALQKMLGLSTEELSNIFFTELTYLDDVTTDLNLFKELIEGKRNHYQVEKRFYRKDNELAWGRLTMSLVRGPDCEPQFAIGMIEDITERKRIEEALYESEARFRATFEDAAIGIARVDLQGRPIESNPALQKMLGFNMEELSNTLFTELTYLDDLTAEQDLFRELIEGKRNQYQVEKRYYRKDGNLVWGRFTITLVRDHDGEPQFAIGMVEDITERKRSEEELKIKAQLLDTATDSIFVHDLEGNFVYINEAAYKSLGYSKDEMMGMNLCSILAPDYADLFDQQIKKLLEKGEAIFESVHFDKNRSIIPVEVHASIIESGGKELVLSVARDITERKQAEKMRKENAKAELYGFVVSALPVFAAGVPLQIRDTLVSTFAERFEKNVKPRLEEVMKRSDRDLEAGEEQGNVLEIFMSWLSELFSNLGIQSGINIHRTGSNIEFLNCPWIGEARGNPIFCLICRAMIVRSFEWTSLKGSVAQKSSIVGGSNTCRFEVHLYPLSKGEEERI